MSGVDISTALAQVRSQIAAATAAAGRDPQAVRLVAVSKTVGAEAVWRAMAAGQTEFGENQVQELVRKEQTVPGPCTWHLIGHLQGNKVRLAIRAAAWIHSVDSVPLLERIERVAGEEGRCPAVLLQVNLSGEASKSGLHPGQAEGALRCALRCRNLSCRGLMVMAPFDAPEAQLHTVFGGLRQLRDRLQDSTGTALPELSMGMSGDFAVAIREGATLVRIGTAIFGPRA